MPEPTLTNFDPDRRVNMGKRDQYRDSIDPEICRWGQKYPKFPGVAECARLILSGKASGTWADLVEQELAEHATEHLEELIASFCEHSSNAFAIYILMALEIAAVPSSVDFLSEVLQHENAVLASWAERALIAIDTREARRALFNVIHRR